MQRRADSLVADNEVFIEVGNDQIAASLSIPVAASGLVLFAHGSGSSRFSPRNRWVADFLNDAGYATLLADLLTSHEAEIDQGTAEFRFDIELLAERLVLATDHCLGVASVKNLPFGYFG